MGLSGSKCSAPAASSPSSSTGTVVRRNRSTRSRLLKSSCLRSNRFDDDEAQESDFPGEENGSTILCPTGTKTGSCQVSGECYRKDKADQNNNTNCLTSDIGLDEWGESSFTDSVSREHNTSRALSSQSLNPPSRFLSRFSVYPGNLSFRLSRAKSLGSSNPYPTTSASITISNEEEEREDPSVSAVTRRVRSQGCEFFPTCFNNRPFRMRHGHCASNDLHFGPHSSDCSDNLQDQRMNARHDMGIHRGDARIDCNMNLFSPINNSNTDGAGLRRANRRIAARERIERNIRFSRTLSVGRLRDRVLRRSFAPDLDLYRFQQDGEVRHSSRATERQDSGDAPGEATSYGNDFSRPVFSSNALSDMSISFYGTQNQEFEIPQARDTRYHDLVEHQSNFVERRRRIRSQVRALQRLGSRLENLSSHERSCILSGQHLAGRCTCHVAAREVNSSDEAAARASISRIGMLAEALFEVLDEIHQQSVALSTRHTASSIASIPAPNEVVESLPLKIFSKLKRKPIDEAAQCYICLVEYEDGDSMRMLPCHHEFHRACVDKWLKEIHRVCPLCRGDICRPDSLTT